MLIESRFLFSQVASLEVSPSVSRPSSSQSTCRSTRPPTFVVVSVSLLVAELSPSPTIGTVELS